LMKQGVIVRPVALYDMPEYIRVTVGTEDENLYFLKKLKELT
jgi:histidinol-phosphate aminotransferase